MKEKAKTSEAIAMAKLLRKRKLYEIFAQAMEQFLIHLELLQLEKKAIHFKLFAFEGLKWFFPVSLSSPISEETLLMQKYQMLRMQFKNQGIPFVKSFAEFKKRLHVYKKVYKIECVEGDR